MELDDLKNTWSQYDKMLADNLRLNEELLRKLNLNSSKREMQKVLVYELINIVTAVLVIIFTLWLSVYYINLLRFCIPGFITIAVSAVYLILGIIRTKGLLNIDYYGSPVVKVQTEILTLKRKTLHLRKYELILLPLLLLPLLPLLFKFVHNIDIYKELSLLVFEVVLITGLAYPLLMWTYKHFYDKKFKNAENLLAELDKFKNEE